MGTFVVLAILIAVVAISLRSVIKNKKANKCGCGCGCGCSGCSEGSCSK
ncbi:MAG: FeoB-associated Cys-rich membrane protein [Spirochaetia bacterium]|nr:FeoB-associated Cys-rich membrane protein [Spirochaetia bacterium]